MNDSGRLITAPGATVGIGAVSIQINRLSTKRGGREIVIIKKMADIKPAEITDPQIYQERRRFIRTASGLLLAGAASATLRPRLAEAGYGGQAIEGVRPGPFAIKEKRTAYKDITSYNNFYEFGTDKRSPALMAGRLKTDRWKVTVEGAVSRSADYYLEDILKGQVLEERIYRMRCVEGWSMVIPWIGFPLRDLIKRLEPHSRAKYIEFQTLFDPAQMPGQQRNVLDWPYVEGLRMDEAMHPLTILAVGLYGEILPNQNGAPLRLVVPWKYGFKGIKSIVKIRFLEEQPQSSWMRSAPNEYGFFANVNPRVSHPRWSQRRERRIGEFRKRKTLMFNGYAEQVAHLYQGMDLKKNF